MRPFRHANLNWFWGSYTPVYLGVAQAAFDELRRVVHARKPEGYTQSLAYHPDVRGKYRDADRGYDRYWGDKREYRAQYADGYRRGYMRAFRSRY